MKSLDQIIKQLCDGTLREDATVEMKRMLGNNDVLAKVLVGLANSGGGHLIVGVEDFSGAVGLMQDTDEIRRIIDSVCKNYSINIKTTLSTVNLNGTDVIIVEIIPLNIVT